MPTICQAFFWVLGYKDKEDVILLLQKLPMEGGFVIRMITLPSLLGHFWFILAFLP